MAYQGEGYEAYLKEVWVPMAQQMVYRNGYFLGSESPFEIIPPEKCVSGENINMGLDYAISSNAGLYTVGDAMVTPAQTSTVKAYFDKDFFQETVKTYKMLKHMHHSGQGGSNLDMSTDDKAMKAGVANLIDAAMAQMLADIVAWISATTAFSDAALDRTVYTSLVSYEATTVGALALADMEDALEALEDVTYGPVKREDLAWLMPRNQLTNLSRLTAGVSNMGLNASSDGMNKIDGDRSGRTKTFGDVPIFVVPDMSTATILLVNRKMIKVYNWAPLEIEPKSLEELAQAWALSIGVCIGVEDPRQQGKLSGVDA